MIAWSVKSTFRKWSGHTNQKAASGRIGGPNYHENKIGIPWYACDILRRSEGPTTDREPRNADVLDHMIPVAESGHPGRVETCM